MARPLSFVRLDIARFGIEISDRPDDKILADWVRKFHRALALQDPNLCGFASKLLEECAEFRANDANRKRNPLESTGIHRKDMESTTDHSISEQSRPKQTKANQTKAKQIKEILPDESGKAERPRNQIWDCLCFIFQLRPITKSEKSRLGKSVRDFTEKGADSGQIKIRSERYRQTWPKAAFTPEALFKHWDLMGQETSRGINGSTVSKNQITETMQKVLLGGHNDF